MHITKAERKKIIDFCQKALTALWLPRHELVVMDDPADPDAYAQLEFVPDRLAAGIKVSEWWMELPSQRKVHALTHEVMHLAQRDLEVNALAPLYRSESVSAELYAIVKESIRHHFEVMVDRLSQAFCATGALTWKE